MFQSSTPLLEIVLRVSLVFVGVFVLLRVVGKKEIGQLAPMDFLAMLLLSETVSPALTRQDSSVTASLVAAGTLIGLTLAIDWVAYRWRGVARVVQGVPQVLIHDGKVVADVQRREKLSDEEVQSALRREGVEHASDVRLAVVEPSGRITVVRR
jgi:uncharacterized membrane protein YcaP (DUF421 family)